MIRATIVKRLPQYNFGHPALNKSFGIIPRPPAPQKDSGIRKTTMDNGTTVITHDKDGAISAFGLYAEAGAKFDPVTAPGLSYVMRWAIQTSNMENSLFQLDRTMRAHGVAYGHGEVRKRHIFWKGEGRRDMIESPFSVLATCISAPRFHEADVERFRDTMDNLLEEQRFKDPRTYAVDQLETIAYFKEPLGRPRHVWEIANDKANHATLLNQWATYFTPKRITVSAVNIDHDKLVAMYTNLPYPHSADAPHHARATQPAIAGNEETQFHPGKEYVEIEDRAKAMSDTPDMLPEMIAAFGWPTYGRDKDLKQYATALVASELINVALCDGTHYDRSENHHGVRGFYRPYESAGMFGFTVRGNEEAAKRQVHTTMETIRALKPSDMYYLAAKNRAIVRMYNEELERSSDYADFLATSKHGADEIEKAVKAVEPAAVQEVLKVFSSTKPAMFVTGSALSFPSLKQLGF